MPHGNAKSSKPRGRAARPRRAAGRRGSAGLVGEGPVIPLTSSGNAAVLRASRLLAVDLAKSGSDKGWWWNFALSDTSGSSEFTALFKEWKLNRVDVGFIWTPSSLTSPEAGPRMFFTADPTTATTPSSEDELLQQGCKQFSFSLTRNTFRVSFTPRVTQLVASAPGSGSTVNNAVMPPNTWLSTNQPTTGYGALVAWIQGYNNSANTGVLRMTTAYHFTFRGLR